jgi:DNA-binding response OmpR family regulator
MADALILVVDDEHNIRNLLRMYLEQEGYTVEDVADGATALQRLDRKPHPDLMVLDLMLPGVDGWEICRRVRAGQHGELPILMLTARDDDVDKIVGLELGADDYVTKPFNPREVVARVKAILRRADRPRRQEDPGADDVDQEMVLAVNDLKLDLRERRVTVGGEALELRRKEFDLLAALLRHREAVLSRDRLLDEVWGYDYVGQTRTIDVHIASLRRKLAATGLTAGAVEIETVTGIGYRLTANPR